MAVLRFKEPGLRLWHAIKKNLITFFYFHCYYIPRWNLTSSMSFHHSVLDCTLILHFLHPTLVMSSSNPSHHLSFGLPLFLYPFSRGSVWRTFFAGSLSSILITCPAHLSLPSLIKYHKCKSFVVVKLNLWAKKLQNWTLFHW